MPLVSIIIPNFNHELFLEERIESVLNQTYQDFEIIILDDMSTDRSRSIIERYRNHPKITHILYNDENSGSTFKQWRKGFEISNGKYIWIAESDDSAENEFLETLVRVLESDHEIALAYSASNLINGHSEKTGILKWGYDVGNRDWTKNYKKIGSDEIKDYLFYKNTVPNASAVVFRKSKIPYQSLHQITLMRFAGDWFFWVKLLESNYIYFHAKPLNNFRQHQNTTRAGQSLEKEKKRFIEYFVTLNYIKKKYGTHWSVHKHAWILNDFVAKINIFDSIRKLTFLKIFPIAYYKKIIRRSLRLKYMKNGA